jgi:autoinducer 2-degrading protein
MFVIVVTFRIKPEHRAQFEQAILANAAESLASEPGCHLFDVCNDAVKDEIFLYEVYQDPAAFDLHLASPHFKAFDALSAPWVVEKRVQRMTRLNNDALPH